MTNRRTRWSQTAEESSANRSLASDSLVSRRHRTGVDVRSGSLADILTSPRHVLFTPKNGRWAAHIHSQPLFGAVLLTIGF